MTTPSSAEAGLSPEARRKAADALVEYIGRRWVVCDHAQIIDPGGAVDAVVAALNEHDADEVTQLRAERAPALVALPPSAAGFLATLVGGTGDFVWGDIAAHYDLTADQVRELFDILTAAARGIEGAGRD